MKPHRPTFYRYRVAAPGLRAKPNRYGWKVIGFAVVVGPYAYCVKMGRKAGPQDILQPVGNFTGVEEAREAMGMPWANRDGLREAIPPAYTEYIGRQMIDAMALVPALEDNDR